MVLPLLTDIYAKQPSDIRVVVAMSGGVDSSVAAALMKQQGYQVIGITLQLYDHGEATQRKGACCAGQDIQDARNVATHLDIPHYVLDYESRFRQAVIEDFADSYVRGETPLPCVRCNQSVKFRDLLQETERLEADALVTGHYIRQELTLENQQGDAPNSNGMTNGKGMSNGRGMINSRGLDESILYRAVDNGKDQSYFLFATTKHQLAKLYFPLGHQSKEETRKLADDFGLPVANKPDSQDICFVPNGNYRSVLEKLRPEAFTEGEIVDEAGNILGKHNGIVHYTIGQRKGLGIGGRDENSPPLYVLALDAESQRVIVGEKNALGQDAILLAQCNWLVAEDELFAQADIMVKYRSTMQPVDATLERADNGAKLIFSETQQGISAGQAAVCYRDNRLLGGGWIADKMKVTL